MNLSQKRAALSDLKEYGISQRRGRVLLEVSRSFLRYQSKNETDPLLEEIKKLALKYPKYGYRMIHSKLRERHVVNAKKVYRLYLQANLQLKKPTRKKKCLVTRRHSLVASKPDQIWSMDFVHDRAMVTAFRTLNIIDNYTRESTYFRVDRNLNSRDVILALEHLIQNGRKPEVITCDNGPEFRANQFQKWCAENNIKIDFIEPGNPRQNPFVESFNGTFRDECLRTHIFKDLLEAKTIISNWQKEYNHERPHSSIGKIPPARFKEEILAGNWPIEWYRKCGHLTSAVKSASGFA